MVETLLLMLLSFVLGVGVTLLGVAYGSIKKVEAMANSAAVPIYCELCGGEIDVRLRFKRIGQRTQHMEQRCVVAITDWPGDKP